MCHRDIVQQHPTPQSADNGAVVAAPAAAEGKMVPETGGGEQQESAEKVDGSECSSIGSSTDSATTESDAIDQEIEGDETEAVEADRI